MFKYLTDGNNNIIGFHLTRGDSVKIPIYFDSDGTEYHPKEGDDIKFGIKRMPYDEVMLEKTIPYDQGYIELVPEDTKEFPLFGKYIFDLQITVDGAVSTVIEEGKFELGVEVSD